MSETLTVRLPLELATALRKEARDTGLRRGEITRQALVERLQKGGKLVVMRRYFGVATGPPDLSSNKLYRRNWKKVR